MEPAVIVTFIILGILAAITIWDQKRGTKPPPPKDPPTGGAP